MNNKKYYTDDQRRRYALDIELLSASQALSTAILTEKSVYNNDGYRYLAWSEIDQDYYQTSTIEDEGLTLVSYDEFLRINNLKK